MLVVYNYLKNRCSLKFFVINKWYSKGFPSQPAWGWNKASPKKSLSEIGMDHTAKEKMPIFS